MVKTERVGAKKLQIKPIIEDSRIIHVEVGSEALPLKSPIPLESFSDFIDKLEALAEYVDFEGESGWGYDEIEYFLWVHITDKASQFFRILAKDGGWVRRDIIQEEIKIKGRALAGILSSPGHYFSRWRKDPLYEMNKRKEESDDEEYYYYRIKTKYLGYIREVFEIE